VARISYDEQTAAAFKAVREVPRAGLSEWCEAVRRHLRPSQEMTLVDIGAGTGAFAAAFSDWRAHLRNDRFWRALTGAGYEYRSLGF
jgi:hypothetical protein